MITFVCVMRSGGDFQWKHALDLWNIVTLNAPNCSPISNRFERNPRFVILSDLKPIDCGLEIRPLRTDWPGWWSKMELFSPEHEDLGDFIYMDLDTVVVGPLAWMMEAKGDLMLRDFYFPHQMASGLMRLTPAGRAAVWQHWQRADPQHWMREQARGGDQVVIRSSLPVDGTWQDQFPGKVVSYKVDVRGRAVPPEASVVCFHGQPRPWDCVAMAPWLKAQFL